MLWSYKLKEKWTLWHLRHNGTAPTLPPGRRTLDNLVRPSMRRVKLQARRRTVEGVPIVAAEFQQTPAAMIQSVLRIATTAILEGGVHPPPIGAERQSRRLVVFVHIVVCLEDRVPHAGRSMDGVYADRVPAVFGEIHVFTLGQNGVGTIVPFAAAR